MGRTIEKPKFWGEEWYKEMKSKRLGDEEIAEQLLISLSVFNHWKRELNLPKYAYTFSRAKGKGHS